MAFAGSPVRCLLGSMSLNFSYAREKHILEWISAGSSTLALLRLGLRLLALRIFLNTTIMEKRCSLSASTYKAAVSSRLIRQGLLVESEHSAYITGVVPYPVILNALSGQQYQ